MIPIVELFCLPLSLPGLWIRIRVHFTSSRIRIRIEKSSWFRICRNECGSMALIVAIGFNQVFHCHFSHKTSYIAIVATWSLPVFLCRISGYQLFRRKTWYPVPILCFSTNHRSRHLSHNHCFGTGSGFRGLLDPNMESGSRGLKHIWNV